MVGGHNVMADQGSCFRNVHTIEQILLFNKYTNSQVTFHIFSNYPNPAITQIIN